jgi:hypothetical protein
MGFIDAFVRWKGFWQAQAPITYAERVRVDALAIVNGQLSLRRLGKRDAQEPGGLS